MTDTEALLAAAIHEDWHSEMDDAVCDCPETEWVVRHAQAILATPSGQRLLADIEDARSLVVHLANRTQEAEQRLLAPTERERALEAALLAAIGTHGEECEAGEACRVMVDARAALAAQPDAPEAAS